MVQAAACARGCPEPRTKHGWTYGAVRHHLGGLRWNCDYQLSFNGHQLRSRLTLVTPFGTLDKVGAEEPGDDQGWLLIDERASDSIPYQPASITRDALAAGYYPSDGRSRLRGTPDSWVYLTYAKDPGWVAPERLFDLNFLAQHPWAPLR